MSNKKLSYFSTIKFLSKYILKYKRNFIMFYTGWFADTLLTIIIPVLFSIMINEIVYYQNISLFLKISGVFAFMLVFSCLIYFLIYAQHHYLNSMYVFDIKMDIYDHFLRGNPLYLNSVSSGDIITNIQLYSSECMAFIIRNVIHTSNHIITVIAVVIYLMILNYKIGLLIIIAAPLSVAISIIFGAKIRKNNEIYREHYGSYIGWLYEMLSSLRDIRMISAQKKVNRLFTESHRKLFKYSIKSIYSELTAQNIIDFVNLCIQLAIFALIGFEAVSNNITVGTFTVLMTFYSMLVGKIKILSESYLNAQHRISCVQRIYDFLASPAEGNGRNKKLSVTEGNIKINSLSFGYGGGNDVLKNFNLTIKGGERIAVAGKSGCGKTTLAYLMTGFYEPGGGYIEIDGQNLAECTLRSVRDNIGIVQQDITIFDGTIKENIFIGNTKASQDEIILACKNAGLWDFISSLPLGLDTVLGKDGINISGGQKQRISIARIYLKNPRIIIFDEATSALDSETESEIFREWETVLRGRTSVIITHRFSTLAMCDRAALMENGVITELGQACDMAENNKKISELFVLNQ